MQRMKIQLLSDLHLEVHPAFVPEPAPGADLLVLAGDIGSYQNGTLLQDEDFGLARFSPLPQYAGWPTPVLFVPGNHEYDGQDFGAAHARLRATCERLGLVWLERETAVLDGVRFAGTTLWSDFDALADAAGVRHGRAAGDAQQSLSRRQLLPAQDRWHAGRSALSGARGARAIALVPAMADRNLNHTL